MFPVDGTSVAWSSALCLSLFSLKLPGKKEVSHRSVEWFFLLIVICNALYPKSKRLFQKNNPGCCLKPKRNLKP